MARQVLTDTPTALAGVPVDLVYTLQNRSSYSMFVQVGENAPADESDAFEVRTMDWATVRKTGSESIWVWQRPNAGGAYGAVVYAQETLAAAPGGGGGGNQTLSTITGTLALAKGGTGYNATSLNDLKTHLGIDNPDPASLGLTEGADEANKFVTLDSTGTGFATKGEIEPADAGLTEGSGESGKFVTLDSSGTGFASKSEVDLPDLGLTEGLGEAGKFLTVDSAGTGLTAKSEIAPGDAGLSTGSGEGGKFVTMDSAGTGFATKSEISASDAGLTGGSGDAGKFVTMDSAGTGFAVKSDIDPSDAGLTEGSGEANKFVTMNSTGTGFDVKSDIEPADLGLTENASEAGKHVVMDSSGTGFTLTDAPTTPDEVTLSTITGGPLSVGKGGTGFTATDLADLQDKLGIYKNSGGGDNALHYANNADTQAAYTIQRTDSSTANTPTGVADGMIVRVGDDQWLTNLADGKQWKRTLTHSHDNANVWTTPVAATLTELDTEDDFRTLAEGSRGWTNTSAWLPSYSNGSKATKVIVGRNGDYLVAIDRYNFWWATRPSGNTWTSIDWHWEDSNGTIPSGLIYTGGEADEHLIPAGEDAVLGGKSGIDGTAGIMVLVDHQISGGNSSFTGYFVNDDNAQTIQSSTNGVTITSAAWTRVQVDTAGINDDIMVTDASGDTVFLGKVLSLEDVSFASYTNKGALAGMVAGDVFYNASLRRLYVIPKAADPHLASLFKADFEVEIRKDSTNYVRGVFTAPLADLSGTLIGGEFRAADLVTVGTIATGDTVSIVGHRAFIAKTDTLQPVNLGITQGSAEAGKTLMLNSDGTGFTASTVAAGNTQTLATITGTLSLEKGGTGTSQTTLAGLKSYLGIGSTVTLTNITGGPLAISKGGTGSNASNLAGLKTYLGIADPDPASLGLTEGAAEAGKFVTLDSAGTGFASKGEIDPGDAGITTGSGESGKFVTLDSSGTGFTSKDDIEPSDLGLTEALSEAGKHVVMDTAGTGFALADAPAGAVTLASITGTLATSKGGTGLNANDLADLRNKLGITGSAGTSEEDILEYLNAANVQKENTIYRFDSSTTNKPADASTGMMIRVGNLQIATDFSSGYQWKRNLTTTHTGTWTAPTSATLTNLANEAAFRGLVDGGRGFSSTAAWLPEYSNGNKPAKIIVGRKGNYLVAIDRYNFWWAARPTGSTWTSIDWHWEAHDGPIPSGLFYTGGDRDEELIPVGEDSVLAGKTGIDGTDGVTVLVNHALSSGNSVYTAYFINDDGAMTIQTSQTGRVLVGGSWSRVQMDANGIDDAIITTHSEGGTTQAAFLGVVPSIDNLIFDGYTMKSSNQNLQVGELFYNTTSRSVFIRAKLTETYMDKLFNEDYEVEIRKDATNYIKGVFSHSIGIGNVAGGTYRIEDLEIVGTISADDTVSIRGHQSFLGKHGRGIIPYNLRGPSAIPSSSNHGDFVTVNSNASGFDFKDGIRPQDLGLTEGSAQGGHFIKYDSAGTGFNDSDTITPGDLGLTTGSGQSGKTLMLNSAGTGFTATTVSEGTLPSSLDLPAIAKSGTYTVSTSQPSSSDAGRFTLNGEDSTSYISPLAGESSAIGTMLSTSMSEQRKVFFVEDESNYIEFIVASTSISNGVHTFTCATNSQRYHGSVAPNDTGRLWLQPNSSNKLMGHSALGDDFALVSPQPTLIFRSQGNVSQGAGNAGSYTQYCETNPFQLVDPILIGRAAMHLTFHVNFSMTNSSAYSVDAQAGVRALFSSTENGTYSLSDGFVGNANALAYCRPGGTFTNTSSHNLGASFCFPLSLPGSIINGNWVKLVIYIRANTGSQELHALQFGSICATIYPEGQFIN